MCGDRKWDILFVYMLLSPHDPEKHKLKRMVGWMDGCCLALISSFLYQCAGHIQSIDPIHAKC